MIPTILGFPLWYGKVKNRVAKKYCSKRLLFLARKGYFKNIGVGSLVNACAGYNVRIVGINPVYFRVGTFYKVSRGYLLQDLEITIDSGGYYCSFVNCISPAKTKEDILLWVKNQKEHLENNGDPWGFLPRLNSTSIDDDGIALQIK